MPQIYHAVPRCGIQGVPLALSLLIEDEGVDLLRVFLEYEARGAQRRLRLLPTDGYRGETCYSLYTVTVPAEDLAAEQFVYHFALEEEKTREYALSLMASDDFSAQAVEPPAILPLFFEERFCFSRGALCLRFLTFSQDVACLRVFVKTDATWQALDAVPNEMGEWECIVPLTLLQKAKDRLSYFVEASAERGSASLGSEARPLSISLFDDAGPALVRVCPADGETVAKNPPDIRVEYEDASGVDMYASAVYLDGRNVGEKAVWTENGMSFRPPTPLFCGEHLLEISLRDTRGNRTYRRFLFYVESASRTQEESGKKSVSAVQAAGFFAGAFAVLKRLFLHKD